MGPFVPPARPVGSAERVADAVVSGKKGRPVDLGGGRRAGRGGELGGVHRCRRQPPGRDDTRSTRSPTGGYARFEDFVRFTRAYQNHPVMGLGSRVGAGRVDLGRKSTRPGGIAGAIRRQAVPGPRPNRHPTQPTNLASARYAHPWPNGWVSLPRKRDGEVEGPVSTGDRALVPPVTSRAPARHHGGRGHRARRNAIAGFSSSPENPPAGPTTALTPAKHDVHFSFCPVQRVRGSRVTADGG